MNDLVARLIELRRSDQFADLFTDEPDDITECCSSFNCVEE